ncbi:MAG: AtpZ/AtpI family protein [Bacteroidota bacterium]
MEQRDKKLFEDERSALQKLAPFLTLGIQLALSVVLFFFIGKWMDDRFNTSPWLMLGGLIAGGVGGMVKFITSVMKLGQQQDALDAERKRQKKV